MHIPDGFIPLWQCSIYFIIAAIFVIRSFKWANNEMDNIPLFATLAAGIFAIQAMNIPIPWGTSGHMVGAVMAAIILGSPWAGVLLLTLVLLVQGVVFADGGITTLGVNIFNMGIVSCFVGFYSYSALKKMGTKLITASFIGAWIGLFVSSLVCAVELWAAGTFPLIEGLYFMGIYHAVIGLIGEGLITSIVCSAMLKTRPDIFSIGKKVSA